MEMGKGKKQSSPWWGRKQELGLLYLGQGERNFPERWVGKCMIETGP